MPKRILMLAVLGLALQMCFPVCAQTLDKIRKSGVITLGYIDGAAPFSYADGNGQPQGYSVELCNAVAEGVAAQLKRQGLKVRWVKLTIQDRIEAVRSGKVDLECSTTTWTLTRQRLVDFSLVTFVDGGSMLVRSDADIARVADFDGKRIAVISGTTTERALRGALTRGMVKAAQRGFGKSLAREWGPEGIRVNLIGPVAMTPALVVAYKANPVLESRLVKRTPLQRVGDPATDIGPAAVFFASDLARFVAGQTLIVDGGGFMGL